MSKPVDIIVITESLLSGLMQRRDVLFDARRTSLVEERVSSVPTRPCIQCGKPKRHPNAYCSAECCRAHREERRS